MCALCGVYVTCGACHVHDVPVCGAWRVMCRVWCMSLVVCLTCVVCGSVLTCVACACGVSFVCDVYRCGVCGVFQCVVCERMCVPDIWGLACLQGRPVGRTHQKRGCQAWSWFSHWTDGLGQMTSSFVPQFV